MARLLIIEDNEPNIELMAYLLNAYGHTTLTAVDGEPGLEIARREQLDLIICDVHLPNVDGYEVVKRLKSHPAQRSIPVIAVTALAMVGDRDKVLAAGFDGYIAKPIEPESFVRQIEAFLPEKPLPCAVSQNGGVNLPETKMAQQVQILVVDNSSVNLELLESLLKPSGYQVISAHNVQEAVLLAEQHRPRLIISDLHMPGEDGFVFIHKVKTNPCLRGIPFVFLSSTIWQDQDEKQGLLFGADKFIRRPIDPQKLLIEIDDCLKK